MHGARDLAAVENGLGVAGQRPDGRQLIGDFVEAAAAGAKIAGPVGAGNHQHRLAVGIGVAHGGGDVGHPGAGDDATKRRLAGDSGVAVGHEAAALFVTEQHVMHAGIDDAAIVFQGMNPRHAEDRLDPVGPDQLHQCLAPGKVAARHGRSP